MRFLGIDLGWRSQPSGVCCLEWSSKCLIVTDLQRIQEIEDIQGWILAHCSDNTGIAIDAPTVITNPSGMRNCDRLTHRYFGKYDAGCYPANLASPFADRTTGFAKRLVEMGFDHAPHISPHCQGRWQIEVFPHPAIVQLFQLPKILKYKKGRLRERSPELAKLHQLILTKMPLLEPNLGIDQRWLMELTFADLTGHALKTIEDQLDSLICAYVAAHWWYWGTARNLVLGDGATGFIVIPNPNLAQPIAPLGDG